MPEVKETYYSRQEALQERMHVFIKAMVCGLWFVVCGLWFG